MLLSFSDTTIAIMKNVASIGRTDVPQRLAACAPSSGARSSGRTVFQRSASVHRMKFIRLTSRPEKTVSCGDKCHEAVALNLFRKSSRGSDLNLLDMFSCSIFGKVSAGCL